MANCSDVIRYNKYTKLEDAKLVTGNINKKDPGQRDSRTPINFMLLVINDEVDDEIKDRNQGRGCPSGCDYVDSKVVNTKEGNRNFFFYWSEKEWVTDENGHDQETKIYFRTFVSVKLKVEVIEVYCEKRFEPSLEEGWGAINWDQEEAYAIYRETGMLPTEEELSEKT